MSLLAFVFGFGVGALVTLTVLTLWVIYGTGGRHR